MVDWFKRKLPWTDDEIFAIETRIVARKGERIKFGVYSSACDDDEK
jgi:hypothetical protein